MLGLSGWLDPDNAPGLPWVDGIESVQLTAIRRGGTLSITGVYTAWVPFFPLGAVMDRQLTMRVG